MNIDKERLAEIVAKLRQERDELKLKAHLGTMEAKEEWEELEKKWQRLEGDLSENKEKASEAAKDLGEKAKVIADEIGQAYRRIRERISSES